MREYGGYFPIELNRGNEYFMNNCLKFNCARSALEFVITVHKFDLIYIPIYLCESVYDTLSRHEIKIEMYHIDENMEPQLDSIEKNAIIFITNYYGIKHNKKEYVEKYKNVIFDNTQAFFEKPIEDAYNIYSCRKFLGVSDGAYLVSNLVNSHNDLYNELSYFTPTNAEFLLKSMNESTDAAYHLYLEQEKEISVCGMKKMSKCSQRILENVNYEEVKAKRIENFSTLEKYLSDFNEFKFIKADDVVPMIYPFMDYKVETRKYLIQNKIYVSQWWKWILDEKIGNECENELAQFLLPIPIDQRYSGQDMEDIAKIILNFCREK